jgi:DNA-binding SARP family transcriptional activator
MMSADPTGTGQLRVRFLGEFSVVLGGQEITSWGAGKARHLFQYLLLNHGQVIPAERLQKALWPNTEASRLSSSLRVAAHALRQILCRAPDDGQQAGLRIDYRNVGYVIQVADLWADIAEFQAAVREGLRNDRAGRPAQAAVLLRRAVELYRGDFLVAEDADWAVGRREFFKSLMITALVTLRDQSLRAGDLPTTIELAQQILELDRYHEDSYRLLIEIHCQRGEIERAYSWYQLCYRRLQADLSIGPSSQTSAAIWEFFRGRQLAAEATRSRIPLRPLEALPSIPGRGRAVPRSARAIAAGGMRLPAKGPEDGIDALYCRTMTWSRMRTKQAARAKAG